MKKSLLLTAEFIGQLEKLRRAEQVDALLALLEFGQVFGKPHLHSGLGIRKLIGNHFECRAGLQLRLVVRHAPDRYVAWFIGSHDEIRRLMRKGLIA